MDDLPRFDPGPGGRQELVRALRHRRSRRNRVLGATAAVVAAVGGLAYALGPGGPPPQRGTATPRAEAGRAHSPSVSLDALPCAKVRVGAAPAACAGAFSKPTTPGSSGRIGAFPSGGASSPGSTGAPQQPFKLAIGGSGAATGRSVVAVAVGRSIAVILPAADGVVWGAPSVGTVVPASGTEDTTGVMQPVRRPAGANSGHWFEARRPGAVTLTADGWRSCTRSPGPCGVTVVVWQIQVVVRGS